MKKKETFYLVLSGIFIAFYIQPAPARGEDSTHPLDYPALSLADETPSSNAITLSLTSTPQWVFPEYPEAGSNTETSHRQPIQISPVPFAGYQDTYGFLGGAALSIYDPNNQTRLITSFLTNFEGYVRYKARFDLRRPGEWLFSTYVSVGNDIQHYYGEGDDTPNVFQTYLGGLDLVGASFQYALSKIIYIGPSVAFNYRNWTNMTDPPMFANESEFRVGVQATRDDRDDVLETHRGTYYQVGLFTLPSVGNVGFGTDVWQLEGDAREFDTIFGNVILAERANFGWTLAGQPSYSYEYTLGGSYELRGFNTNRFRGLDFYSLQSEARIPIFSWLMMSTGIDAGDVTSTTFTNLPLVSWQIGLRSDIGEPYGVVFRIDEGFSYSGGVFIYSINEPF